MFTKMEAVLPQSLFYSLLYGFNDDVSCYVRISRITGEEYITLVSSYMAYVPDFTMIQMQMEKDNGAKSCNT